MLAEKREAFARRCGKLWEYRPGWTINQAAAMMARCSIRTGKFDENYRALVTLWPPAESYALTNLAVAPAEE